MTRLREQIITPAPIEQAFSYTADFDNIENWDPGIAESQKIGDGRIGQGTQFDLLVAFGTRRTPMVYTITEYDAPRRVVLVGEGSNLTAIDEITFAEVPEGTAVTYQADLAFKGLMKFAAPFLGSVLKGVGRKAMNGLEEALAQIESPTGS